MVLTDKEIRMYTEKHKENGLDLALIDNFQEENLQSESYDITLGNKIAIFKKEIRCIELADQHSIDNMYEQIDIAKTQGYVISPKEYILVSLGERINLPDFLTAHIRPRTTLTRIGLLVSDQHCNSTYSGLLQIGLYNATNYAIKITPGIRIAQVLFEELKSIPSEEKKYKNKLNASYQNETAFIGAQFTNEYAKQLDDFWNKVLD